MKLYNKLSFLVIGGYAGQYRTEKCDITEAGDQVTCIEQEPTLSNYNHYPELLLVAEDFGKTVESC